ncbi:endonuclease/exonuclease/phosphatase family protein [Nocardioides sp. MH1]|uniref:endonuclease/exonuclease/phosphatase family protein n=1 Tax=Nocardioides sp. MH1 TaxID=3242490 RepID=UPI003520F044
MGKHELPRRARLLPVLGVFALVAALLTVGRFAMADNQPVAKDTTEASQPSASASDKTDGTDGTGDDKTKPRDKNKHATDHKTDRKKDRRRSRDLRDKVQLAADGLAADDATFRIASFNVLGASHTAPGGNKRGYALGASRMGWATQLIRGNNISVVGLQEFESAQHSTFARLTGSGWGLYPGMQLGNLGVRNSIGWDTSVWELVEAHTLQIPYFHGKPVPIPYVLLKHKGTGRLAWFINTHNPASTRGPAQHWRDIATSKEIALMNDLQEPQTSNQLGIPTFLTGDFNEKADAFCAVTVRANAQAANGGTASPCRLPANNGIDWIFGSRPGVSFSHYVRLDGGLVNRVSDHPMVYSDVTLTGEAPYVE